jgi:murein DD-endopeptidase MepM/ murein hydrolase activator NlpD
MFLLGACATQPPVQISTGAKPETAQPPAKKPPPAPVARPPVGATAGDTAPIIVHTGDTLYSLSQRHRVPVKALVDANRLASPYTLHVGQRLVPPTSRYHAVAAGETLYGISRLYNLDTFVLAQNNDLTAPYNLVVGQQLKVSGEKPRGLLAATEAPAQPAAITPENPAVADDKSGAAVGRAARFRPPGEPDGAAAPPRDRRFAWPVTGSVLSGFGPKGGGLHNDGVNIAARLGESVKAADNGIVVYAGNELKGYGNLVLVRHADRWVSAYAHNEKLLVKRGDWVKRGQTIARAGNSGSVDSPQVHFEIRRGTQAIDPIPLLASTGASGAPRPKAS